MTTTQKLRSLCIYTAAILLFGSVVPVSNVLSENSSGYESILETYPVTHGNPLNGNHETTSSEDYSKGSIHEVYVNPTLLGRRSGSHGADKAKIQKKDAEEIFLAVSGLSSDPIECIRSIGKMKEFITEAPHSSEAQDAAFFIGDCFYAYGEKDKRSYKRAIDAFQNAVNRYPGHMRVPEAYFKIAQSYKKLGFTYEAGAMFETVRERFHYSKYAVLSDLEIGRNKMNSGDIQSARDVYNMILESNNDPHILAKAKLGLADSMYLEKDFARALRLYARCASDFGYRIYENPQSLLYMGNTLINLKKYGEAREIFSRLINVVPYGEYAHIALTRIGDTFLYENDLKGALKAYSLTVQTFPGTEGALIGLVRMADIGRRNSEISLEGFLPDYSKKPLEVYEHVLKSHPPDKVRMVVTIGKGEILFSQKKYPGIVNMLDDVLKTRKWDSLSNRAVVLMKKTLIALIKEKHASKDYLSVIKVFEKFKGSYLSEDIPREVYLCIAESYENLEVYKNAIDMYTRIIRMNPLGKRNDQVITGIARIFMKLKKYDEVEKVSARFIRAFHDSEYLPEIVLFYAKSLYERKLFDKAKEYLNQIIGRDHKTSHLFEAYFLLGRIYYAQGSIEDLKESYKNALLSINRESLKENSEKIKDKYFQMARDLYSIGDFSEAKKVYEGIVKNFAEDARAELVKQRIFLCDDRIGDEKGIQKSVKVIAERFSDQIGTGMAGDLAFLQKSLNYSEKFRRLLN